MKFSFSGRHVEIGDAFADKAKDACTALANKYGTEFIDLSIVIKKENYLFVCDITAKTKNGESHHASNSANDPAISFDGALQKVDQQMGRKKKTCRNSCKDQAVEKISYDNSFNERESAAIIAEILDDLPLLSVSDAADLLSNTKRVLVFENISNKTVNVVYWREDGNIGWIDYKNPYEKQFEPL
ncbi:MAG: ribosome-associated translation inhibitor RaiA [Holosporaceae bacterium]|jgi:ribosomal subunit interface protein|nr:ribosome-associated translation inhibitor RaiA [Holosporaceae bacterium]